jgi:hypothetical protein
MCIEDGTLGGWRERDPAGKTRGGLQEYLEIKEKSKQRAGVVFPRHRNHRHRNLRSPLADRFQARGGPPACAIIFRCLSALYGYFRAYTAGFQCGYFLPSEIGVTGRLNCRLPNVPVGIPSAAKLCNVGFLTGYRPSPKKHGAVSIFWKIGWRGNPFLCTRPAFDPQASVLRPALSSFRSCSSDPRTGENGPLEDCQRRKLSCHHALRKSKGGCLTDSLEGRKSFLTQVFPGFSTACFK